MSTLGFELEWFDPLGNDIQKLYLKFFLENNTIEVVRVFCSFIAVHIDFLL